MTDKTIPLERDTKFGWLTLNRPEKLNAVDGEMLDELDRSFSGLSKAWISEWSY